LYGISRRRVVMLGSAAYGRTNEARIIHYCVAISGFRAKRLNSTRSAWWPEWHNLNQARPGGAAAMRKTRPRATLSNQSQGFGRTGRLPTRRAIPGLVVERRRQRPKYISRVCEGV